jgi:NAD(P)-dependent dehydrogenase (short-subunit alcohol dehydrogenase family)
MFLILSLTGGQPTDARRIMRQVPAQNASGTDPQIQELIMGSLDNQTAIVTGGAGDLGLAYCLGLAAEGASVVVADVVDTSEVVSEVTTAGGTAVGIEVDVSEAASVESMVAATLGEFGRIDILVNNAALLKAVTLGPFEDIPLAEWDRVMAVNVRGPWLCSRAVIPTMRAQGNGRIINISSNTAWKGVTGFLHYVTSKAAIVGFSRGLAGEVGDSGITVNTVAPDYIPDETLLKQHPGHNEAVVAQRSLPRTQTPDDMVGLITFLAGAGAAFISGQSFLVNGGSHYQ